MASPTSQMAPVPPEAPIPMTPLRRTPIQASSSSSLNSSGLASGRSSSSSLSSTHSPVGVGAKCAADSTPPPSTRVGPGPSLFSPNQNPFADPQQQPAPSPQDPPQPFPDNSDPNVDPARQEVWRHWARLPKFQGPWLQNTIGMAGLAVALVGLSVYAYRGYKMDKYENLMALYQACASLQQAGVTTGGAQCDDVLKKGPPPRPYTRRDIEMILRNATTIMDREDLGPVDEHTSNRWTSLSWLSILVIVVATIAIAFAGYVTSWLRYHPRRGTVFQSPARHEGTVEVTHHHPEGPHKESLQGPMEVMRSISPTGKTINSLRRRLMSSIHDKGEIKSRVSLRPSVASSSGSTLVDEDQGHEDVEHHDGLIELKRTGDTRNFFDPDTGETLHLSPWKSRKESRDDDEGNEHLNKGAVRQTIAQMGVGSAVLGGGTAAEEPLHEHAQTKSHKHPQQMGDLLAGIVTNQPCSVGDALKGHVYD